jgi:hypothetical protein
MKSFLRNLCVIFMLCFSIQQVSEAQETRFELSDDISYNSALNYKINTMPSGIMQLLYDNGPIVNLPGGGCSGGDASVQDPSLGHSIFGWGIQQNLGNYIADDFSNPAPWQIDSILFYAYQTGATTTTITGVYIQIWRGKPNEGGIVVWGDTVTNRMQNVALTNIYRAASSNPTDCSRRIQLVSANVNLSIVPGTYWVQWGMTGSETSGPWCPPVTIAGDSLTGDAIQRVSYIWTPALNGIHPNGAPFFLYGSEIPPSIEITTPNGGENWLAGTTKTITWNSSYVDSVDIEYSTNNGANWINIIRGKTNTGSHNWQVPNTPSANCKVSVKNSANALIRSISNSVFTIFEYPSQINVAATYSFSDATKTSNYKMIGLPGQNNIPMNDIVTGTPGKNGDWRAFWDPGSGAFTEYNGTSNFNFTPGKAFWVISKNEISINQTVNSVTLSGDNTYTIPLHSEWNLISNPFEKNISWSAVQTLNSISQPLKHFQSGSYSDAQNFEPYKGYYLFNSGGLTSLSIPYLSSGGLEKINAGNEKVLELSLTKDNSILSKAAVGFSDEAKNGIDINDVFSPPSEFCEINISLVNNELETNYKFLQEDFRPEIGEGQDYYLSVKNNSDKSVSLEVSGLDYFVEYEVHLVDKNMLTGFDLKKQYNLIIEPDKSEREYLLIIGSKDYIKNKQLDFVPKEFQLYQNYPNPFNPSTKISWQSPVGSHQVLKVFDVLGNEIITLVDEYKPLGRYEVEFNPESGIRNLASGVYFYQLRAGIIR